MPIHSFTYSSDSICDLWLRMVFPQLWRELWGSTKVPMVWHLFHEVFSHQKQKGMTIYFCGRGVTRQMRHQPHVHASFASYTHWAKQTFQVKHWRNWSATRQEFLLEIFFLATSFDMRNSRYELGKFKQWNSFCSSLMYMLLELFP